MAPYAPSVRIPHLRNANPVKHHQIDQNRALSLQKAEKKKTDLKKKYNMYSGILNPTHNVSIRRE